MPFQDQKSKILEERDLTLQQRDRGESPLNDTYLTRASIRPPTAFNQLAVF